MIDSVGLFYQLLLIVMNRSIPHLNHFHINTLKKLHGKGTNRQTDGHRDYYTESAQWANLVKIIFLFLLKLKFCDTDEEAKTGQSCVLQRTYFHIPGLPSTSSGAFGRGTAEVSSVGRLSQRSRLLLFRPVLRRRRKISLILSLKCKITNKETFRGYFFFFIYLISIKFKI